MRIRNAVTMLIGLALLGQLMFGAARAGAQPPAPEQLEPSGSYTLSVRPNFKWRAVDKATAYSLVVYDLDNASAKVIERPLPSTVCNATGECEAGAETDLRNGGAYGWFVAAFDGAAWGPFSAGLAFKIEVGSGGNPEPTPPPAVSVAAPDTAPELLGPAGETFVYSEAPVVTWKPLADVDRYVVRIREAQTDAVIFERVFDASICTTTTCTVRLNQRLVYDSAYTLEISCLNAGGLSPWSDKQPFTLRQDANIPRIVGPSEASASAVVYRWFEGQDVAEYSVEVFNGAGEAMMQAQVEAAQACRGGVCIFAPSMRLPPDVYVWTVRAAPYGRVDSAQFVIFGPRR